MRFEFSTAGRIIFGRGSLPEAITAASTFGKRVLLVTGTGNSNIQRVTDLLGEKFFEVEMFPVSHEPTLELVELGARIARVMNVQIIIACGGGSAIDAGKAIAGLATNKGPGIEYLEVVGGGTPLQNRALPLIAIPTTAGTGSEVTRNAVISVPEKNVKASMRSSFLLPVLAVVDPELTYSVPPNVTASTGMDALSQVIEPFVSLRANPLVDTFCRDGMQRAGRSLLSVFRNGMDTRAREDMSFASLMGGLSLANGGLGAVHGFAAPMGGMFSAPHGVLCARLLGPVIRENWHVLAANYPSHPSLEKFVEAARLTAGITIKEFPDWIESLCEALNIPRLRDLGVRREHYDEIAQKAALASSMQSNPVKLERESFIEILQQGL